MNLDSETEKKIEELRLLENHLQELLMRKQSAQIELNEIENALKELENSDDEVYKVAAGFMLKSSKEKLNKELKEKEKLLALKMKSIEKQEELVEKDAKKLRTGIESLISETDKKNKS
jgi:prefoldin beta subunit